MSLFVYKLIPPRLGVFEAGDADEARAAVEADPAISSGMATMELSPMGASHVRT